MTATPDPSPLSQPALSDSVRTALEAFAALDAVDRSTLTDAERLRLALAYACLTHRLSLVTARLRGEVRRRRALAIEPTADEWSA